MDNFIIKPHEFKHLVEFQRYTDNNVDLDNIPSENEWKTLFKTKAQVNRNQNDEKIIMEGTSKKTIKTFRIRYRKGVQPTNKDRIIYNNNSIWDIKSVNNIKEDNKYLEIKAELIE